MLEHSPAPDRRAAIRELERENKKWPAHLVEVPRGMWPVVSQPRLRVLRSRDYLVQEFHAEAPAFVRLSICRTAMKGDRWKDGISWDDLQRLKNECGYTELDAVEIFPAESDLVNVANMRHLWVLLDPVPFAWRKS